MWYGIINMVWCDYIYYTIQYNTIIWYCTHVQSQTCCRNTNPIPAIRAGRNLFAHTLLSSGGVRDRGSEERGGEDSRARGGASSSSENDTDACRMVAVCSTVFVCYFVVGKHKNKCCMRWVWVWGDGGDWPISAKAWSEASGVRTQSIAACRYHNMLYR